MVSEQRCWLAIETSTQLCSVALLSDGQVEWREHNEARAHATIIMPMIDELLDATGRQFSDINGFVFGQGPGSFTGVRIAVALTQGLALGGQVPVLGVSSLRVLAQQALNAHRSLDSVCVAQDARMSEVYTGRYLRDGQGIAQPLVADAVVAPDVLLPLVDPMVTGTGFAAYAELDAAVVDGEAIALHDSDGLPSARTLLYIAQTTPDSAWTPPFEARAVYVRDEVANASPA